MKNTARVFTGAVMAVLLAGAAQAGGDYVLLAHPEAVDGNTLIDDNGRLYRLHAIDAPDIGQQCLAADGAEYSCGEQARAALADMIDGILTCDLVKPDAPEHKEVRCHDFAGRDIGQLLISAGWALPDRSVGLDYVWEEMEAEARSLGLWQGRFVTPERWRAGARL
ncbi:thermonuclease family protein [Oricola sp.]|uniref:thermonuclease family protein n=1 Tax=Oricola sp. TaxID=1979950 RepID=UPI000C9706B4|nr:hypothetical protein [Ahrensia sp.]MCK5746185.1 thermonuclease family protein [Oricola sp.]|tara:strand:- start:5317 stop:5814 length:498 start_codon:yes stop_codon:yes gene_type:complete